MQTHLLRRAPWSALAAALLLLGPACSKKLEGPPPQVEGVSPPGVCTEQLTSEVVIRGQGLSPLVTGHLADGQLELPRVTLSRTRTLGGEAADGQVALPDDSGAAESSRIRWDSQEQMRFEVFPELELAPGLYDLVLANANGQQATFSGALLAVPPPVLQSAGPDVLCGDKPNQLTLEGDLFIRGAGLQPTVRIGDRSYAPSAMEGCRALPGEGGFEACRTLTVALGANDLANGTHAIVVENPGPVGCATTEALTLTIVPEPQLAKIEADLACIQEGSRALVLTGQGFITVDGEAPTLTLSLGGQSIHSVPTTASECTPVQGPQGAIQTCTRLEATVAQGALPAGNYLATVTNPAPVDCASEQDVRFVVAPPPTLSSLAPELGCNAQGQRTLTLQGTDFLTVNGEAPTVHLTSGAQSVALTSVATGCEPLAGPTETVQRCTTLTAQLGQNALPEGSYAVAVENPAPAGCTSTQSHAYQVTPAPVVTSIQPEAFCAADNQVPVTVQGDGFLRIDGVEPTVTVGTLTPPATTSNCTAVTGTQAAVFRCTTISFTVPQGTAAGVLAVTVENPAPAGCQSAAGPVVAVFGAPAVTDVQPVAVCSAAPDTQIVITGTGFTTFNGTPPEVVVGAGGTALTYVPTAGGCTAVMGTTDSIELCTTLTITVLQGTLPEGTLPLTVTNPGPIGCASSGTGSLEVTPPPTLTDVQPATICSGGHTFTLTGTNFDPAAVVRLLDGTGAGVATAQTVTVTSPTSATATFAGGIPPNVNSTPYTLSLENPDGCSALWGPPQHAGVVVVPGPQIFFVDPNVAYNGINTQATVYGAGFTGAVQQVTITLQGTTTPISLQLSPQTRPNQVQVLLPQGLAPGVYDMALSDGTTCQAMLTGALTVVSQTTLALANPPMDPPFGEVNESTSVQIFAAGGASGTFLPVPRVYLNPTNAGAGTTATALGAVSLVNPTTLSALVPGTLAAGDYDLIVVNPNGTVGYAAAAFRVVTQPPPTITGLAPGSLPNTGGVSFDVQGANFRAGATVTLSCFDAAGAQVASPTTTYTSPTSTVSSITVTVGSTMAAACVVRVTNTDNGTYADYSALVFTNPARNLYAAQVGPELLTARRGPVAMGADATTTARFLHVAGGDSGAGTTFDTVESAPLTLLGTPGAFFAQKNRLNQARMLAGGISIGRWLYVAGGSNPQGATTQRFSTVERAYVLDPEDRAEVTNLFLDVAEGTGLGGGVWYYRVSAVMGPNDPFNPGGENLASDPFPVQLPTQSGLVFHVTVQWAQVPGAAKYRVYRSPTAGATVGTEEVIAEVTATTYTDEGGPSILTDRPLPIGSTGVWHTLTAQLQVAREGPAMSWGRDPANPALVHIYVLGGKTADTSVSNTYEYLTLTVDAATGAHTPATSFSSGGGNTIGTARWQLGGARGTSELSPVFPVGETWIYALSGFNAGATMLVSNVVAGRILPGGALDTFQTVFTGGLNHAGYFTVVAADQLIVFGGATGSPSTTISSGNLCGSAGTACTQLPRVDNFNTGSAMLQPRIRLGGALHGAYIYAVGGVTATSPLTVTKSTEYRIW
jgi:hypothetical protein